MPFNADMVRQAKVPTNAGFPIARHDSETATIIDFPIPGVSSAKSLRNALYDSSIESGGWSSRPKSQ